MTAPIQQPALNPKVTLGDLSPEKRDDQSVIDKMNQLNMSVKLGVQTVSILAAAIADALTESPEERKKRETEEKLKRDQQEKEREKLAKQLKEAEEQVRLLAAAKGSDPNAITQNRSLNPSLKEINELLALAKKQKEALEKV